MWENKRTNIVLLYAYMLLLEIRHIHFVLWKLYINKEATPSKLKRGVRGVWEGWQGGVAVWRGWGLWEGGQRSWFSTNTDLREWLAVISKHTLLHCDTEHSYSPVPWKDRGKGGDGRISIRIIMFILIIMITTIPKHSKKDIYRLKSIL